MKKLLLYLFLLLSINVFSQTIEIIPLLSVSTCDTKDFAIVIQNNSSATLDINNLILDIDPLAIFSSSYTTSIIGDEVSFQNLAY